MTERVTCSCSRPDSLGLSVSVATLTRIQPGAGCEGFDRSRQPDDLTEFLGDYDGLGDGPSDLRLVRGRALLFRPIPRGQLVSPRPQSTRRGPTDSVIGVSAKATSNTGRIAYLDGVRAVAIVAVLGVHWINGYVPIAPGGYIGVDIFFVLSGYIITRILWRAAAGGETTIWQDYTRFLIQRVRRLYPALTAFIMLALVIIAVADPWMLATSALDGLIAEAQGMAIYLAAGGTGAIQFGHAWSLANEWYFYLIWPVILLSAAKRGVLPAQLARWTSAVAVALYVVSLLTPSKWFYFGPTARSAQILVGGAAALFLLARAQARLPSAVAAIIGASGLAIAVAWTVLGSHEFSLYYRFVGYPIATVAALGLIIAGSLSESGPVFRLLSLRPVAYLGRISYSLYLWHLLPMQVLDKDDMPGVPMYLIAAAGVTFAITATLASYYLLERPFIRSKAVFLNRD